MAKSEIDIKNLIVEAGGKKILSDITCSVEQGKITGLLGPSGAGKTTLFRTILGLIEPLSGSVYVFGRSARDKEIHKQVGYMAQSPSIYNDLTVLENLDYFASLTGASKNQIRDLLNAVDLTSKSDQIIKNLSEGEKTRVSLITALLGTPKMLLLDEPTVGLDPILREKLWNIFAKLAKEGTTIMVTSHVMDEANHCDNIMFLRNGKMIASESKSEILSQGKTDSIEEVFLKLAKAES